ncbi:ferredoxin [Desulfovibrio litoralis]|uniref:Ferredoxin n=1 Tax=Desulfovibrio litoralis DSM 11393 TaxID=1121455 RepID=A0A1M7RWF7_9BACT|nr:ferredoxin [Desulfovibrio litoralis]SHN50639.1 ferredoxin [Desulfovibrio litoralis DSM 11393]
MFIVIYEGDCVGCGGCEEVCPSVFIMNSNGDKALVIAPESTAPCVKEAIAICPADCIEMT